MKTIILSLTACLCLPCLLPTAPAAEFYPIVNVTSSTQDSDFFQVVNLIEGPGVGFSDAEPYDRLGSTWVTAACGFPCDYLEGAEPPVIVLDLGSDVDLSEISVWGYANSNANGAKEIMLRFATAAEGETGFGTSITYNPTFPVALDETPRQSLLFSLTVHARYVELTCTDNYFTPPGTGGPDGPPGGDRVGLGEVAFEQVIAAPLPNIVAPLSVTIPPTSQVTDAAVSLRNTGTLPLNITGASLSGPNAAAFAILSRPTTLTTFQSGDVMLRFTPGALTGDITATLSVASNDPDSPSVDILIVASVPPPNLLAPASLTIPPTFDVTDASITLQNTGVLPLTITAATLSGPNASAFTILSQPATIAALASEDLQLRFTPGALTGVVSATLTIVSNDADSPSVAIALIASIPPPTSQFFPIVNVTSSTQDSDLWPASNLIQGPGEGFGEESPHDQLGAGDTHRWVTTACGFPCDYLAGAPPPVIILDLGETRTLEEIDVWGYTSSNANGTKEFQLRFATDAEGTENFGASITYNPTFTIDENNDIRRFQFAFEKPIVARYVEFTCTDNFFVEPGDGSTPGSQPGGDRVGLGEIAFPTSATVGPVAPLAITAVQRNAATRAFTLTFTSETGKTYTIKRSTDLASWVDIANDVPATAATTDFTDSDIAASDREYFYRVTRP